MLKMLPWAAAALMFALAGPVTAATGSSGAGPTSVAQAIDLRFGHTTQRVLYEAPPKVRATLILLPGGTGDIGIQRDGHVRHGDNFLVRTRAVWVARGYAVLIPDTIDHTNLRGRRSSARYGQLVDDLARYAHRQVKAPVFLIGTSQGTIAATKGASRAALSGPDLIAGVVLTEAVSVPGRLSAETVFDADPQEVRAPVLVVANRDDACDVAPPAMASRVGSAMVRAQDVRILSVAGGAQRSQQTCGSLSPHGYYGIESKVIAGIAAWLKAHGG